MSDPIVTAGRRPRRRRRCSCGETRADESASIRSTTSSTSRSLVSISSASSAGCIRARSLSSRSSQVGGERVGADVGVVRLGGSSRTRPRQLRGRPSRPRSGATTVPMSRPSMTTLPSSASSRWRSRITSRTSGWRATTGTMRSISAWRIADVTSVPAIETAPDLVEVDRVLARELAELLAVVEVERSLEREPGQRAVHRAGVEVAEAEPLGEAPRDRALAGPAGPSMATIIVGTQTRAGRRIRGSLLPRSRDPRARRPRATRARQLRPASRSDGRRRVETAPPP